MVNNKTYSATKVSLFIVNENWEWEWTLEKKEKWWSLQKKFKKIQEEKEVVLEKAQKKMKWQANKERREAKEWKKEDKVTLSMKYLIFKERLAKKLVNQYIGLYIIDIS